MPLSTSRSSLCMRAFEPMPYRLIKSETPIKRTLQRIPTRFPNETNTASCALAGYFIDKHYVCITHTRARALLCVRKNVRARAYLFIYRIYMYTHTNNTRKSSPSQAFKSPYALAEKNKTIANLQHSIQNGESHDAGGRGGLGVTTHTGTHNTYILARGSRQRSQKSKRSRNNHNNVTFHL